MNEVALRALLLTLSEHLVPILEHCAVEKLLESLVINPILNRQQFEKGKELY